MVAVESDRLAATARKAGAQQGQTGQAVAGRLGHVVATATAAARADGEAGGANFDVKQLKPTADESALEIKVIAEPNGWSRRRPNR
jgi:hypothetical protein